MLSREERLWRTLRERVDRSLSEDLQAATLYSKALMGGMPRALEVYRRVDSVTRRYDWVTPTADKTWHNHVEGSR